MDFVPGPFRYTEIDFVPGPFSCQIENDAFCIHVEGCLVLYSRGHSQGLCSPEARGCAAASQQ